MFDDIWLREHEDTLNKRKVMLKEYCKQKQRKLLDKGWVTYQIKFFDMMVKHVSRQITCFKTNLSKYNETVMFFEDLFPGSL